MYLCNTHPFKADRTPGSALDGGTYGCMSHVSDLWGLRHSHGRQRTETGAEERHRSAGVGAGRGLECREDKGMTQALFLPTRSLKSRRRAKDINI